MSDAKDAARRTWEEIFPACDVEALAEVIHPDVIEHGARPGEPAGFEGAKQTMLWLASVFSEQRWDIHHVVAEGDLVAVHLTHRGRHTGELMGIPPTGREVAYEHFHLLRFQDGKAVEHWSIHDSMTMMRQLGVLPSPPGGMSAEAGAALPA